ncbi:MAG: GTPase HflX [Candidatus Binatia bacterium]|nr:GTPase HflX [Candidatus Binatia bacterium]
MKLHSITSPGLLERAFLVRAETSSSFHQAPMEDSLDELERLAESAGARVVARITQALKRKNPSTLIGRGKVEEIREKIQVIKPDIVIFDGELSPAQQRNLETAFQIRVIDRSQLILDIFAQRARSKEGKLQVELAQLDYLLPRLTRRWTHLSRLAGGIGTRGPGETQLEVDRRRVRERIGMLKRRLTTVERTRALQRQERLEVPFSSVALVGYTNSGKSTLMNALTRAGVLAEERLFATLDPTTRSLRLPNSNQVMITDTVGFINNIPHALIEAFKSTLEEVRSADLLLHVVDMTSPLLDQQILVVNAVLREIGAGQACHLMVANKIDMVPETGLKGLDCNGAVAVCPVSSLTGQGIDGLLDKISQLFDQGKERVEICLAPHQGSLLPLLYQRGRILEERVEGDRIHLTALVTPKLAGQMKKWLRENGFKDPT